ncbi:hypothetical protein K1719_011085 [Acacia pycnantha]|nr:hypothetical protein K1719_011085 [Acacia pycnantha]
MKKTRAKTLALQSHCKSSSSSSSPVDADASSFSYLQLRSRGLPKVFISSKKPPPPLPKSPGNCCRGSPNSNCRGMIANTREYDIGSDNVKNPKERLAHQKENLRRRLGLDVCEQFMDISDVIRDEDLMAYKSDIHPYGIDHRVFTSHYVHNIQKMVANMVPSVKSNWPSARERNLLKP